MDANLNRFVHIAQDDSPNAVLFLLATVWAGKEKVKAFEV